MLRSATWPRRLHLLAAPAVHTSDRANAAGASTDCRVVISNAYFFKLLAIVLGLQQQPWWAWAGVAVFGLLNTLNAVWLVKLVAMARRSDRKQQLAGAAAAAAAEKASPGAAAAAAASKGASGGAATAHRISVAAHSDAGGLAHKLD
jgi:hypothetical protein